MRIILLTAALAVHVIVTALTVGRLTRTIAAQQGIIHTMLTTEGNTNRTLRGLIEADEAEIAVFNDLKDAIAGTQNTILMLVDRMEGASKRHEPVERRNPVTCGLRAGDLIVTSSGYNCPEQAAQQGDPKPRLARPSVCATGDVYQLSAERFQYCQGGTWKDVPMPSPWRAVEIDTVVDGRLAK